MEQSGTGISTNEAIRLEHRLTKIEEAIVANTIATEAVHARVIEQNGRVGRLESRVAVHDVFRAQILVLIAAFGFLSPAIFGFVFFIVDKVYG